MVYQVYRIHLTNGEVVEAAEDYYTPAGKSFVSNIKRTPDYEWVVVGDPLGGYSYIPKRSIVFISTGDVKEVEDHIVKSLKLMEKAARNATRD